MEVPTHRRGDIVTPCLKVGASASHSIVYAYTLLLTPGVITILAAASVVACREGPHTTRRAARIAPTGGAPLPHLNVDQLRWPAVWSNSSNSRIDSVRDGPLSQPAPHEQAPVLDVEHTKREISELRVRCAPAGRQFRQSVKI